MKINNIQSLGSLYQQDNSKINKKDDSLDKRISSIEDKVMLSKEARELSKSDGLSPKRKAEIEHKIQSGFYDKEEVVEKVADEILKSPEFMEGLKK
ncbi:MAG: hypothetical protein Kow00108_25230 [Calditrichia bacterium]